MLAPIGCVGCGRPEETAAPPAVPVALGKESVVTVERGPIATGPRIAGALEAEQRAVLRAELGGSVLAVHAELGDAVPKGKVLARIEAAPQAGAAAAARASVTSAQEELAVAKRQADRTERLVEAGAVATREAEVARSQQAAAAARLEEARARMSSSNEQLAGA